MRHLSLLVLLILLPSHSTAVQPPESEDAHFERIAREYTEEHFRTHPTWATQAGIHRHDSELEQLDEKSIEERKARLRGTLDQLAWIDTSKLSPRLSIDARFLQGRVRAELSEVAKDRLHERNPGLYVRLAGAGVDNLLKRSFLPLCERLLLAAARAEKVPRLLAQGKAGLRRPPRLWTELAQLDVKGAREFYGQVVPAAEQCGDAAVKKRLHAAAKQAQAALSDFAAFMQKDLLPRSDGSYVLGAARLQEILRDRELVDEPLPKLLERGRRELSRLQKEFAEVARRIDKALPPAKVLDQINLQHPAPKDLLPSTRSLVAQVREFVVSKKIVPIPAGDDLHIEETPLFYRQLSFASMSSPGPFEDKAREAYFYVTPAEPDWSGEKQEQHMRAYDRFSLENTIIHEAYPGHHVQGLYMKEAPTLLRKVLWATTLGEGWALSCERMLLDAGFDPDPRERLIMVQWALIRAARYVASIEMHARNMPFSDVVRLVREQGYLTPANAEREARRYTLDATVMAYTYGQIVIDELRELERRRLGKGFALGEFHRRLLAEGPIPAVLLGEALGIR